MREVKGTRMTDDPRIEHSKQSATPSAVEPRGDVHRHAEAAGPATRNKWRYPLAGHLKRRAAHMAPFTQKGWRAAVEAVRQLDAAERGALLGNTSTIDPYEQQVVQALVEGLEVDPYAQHVAHATALARAFARRRMLLADALTTPEVAALYHASRQMPLDRLRAGTLLAIREHGDWRFPAWQFDPQAPDGVVAGLPQVLAALPTSSLLRAAWLTAWHPALHATPINALRSGQIDAVVHEARAVGAA